MLAKVGSFQILRNSKGKVFLNGKLGTYELFVDGEIESCAAIQHGSSILIFLASEGQLRRVEATATYRPKPSMSLSYYCPEECPKNATLMIKDKLIFCYGGNELKVYNMEAVCNVPFFLPFSCRFRQVLTWFTFVC
jgi:hypothetical protein